MSIKSLNDIDFQSKSGIENSLETIDYSQSAEPTLNTSKEDTLKGHLSYFAKSVNWIKSQFSKYLPLSGGTMSGAIDMNKNPLKNAGFETVTALPTTNLFVGRKVVMNGIEYTYNGVKFIANGISIINGFTPTYLDQFTEEQLSYNDIIYNSPYAYMSMFSQTLEGFQPELIEYYNDTDDSWGNPTSTIPSKIEAGKHIRFTMFNSPVSSDNFGSISSITLWTRHYSLPIDIKVEYRSYNTTTSTYDWFTVKDLSTIEQTCIIPVPMKTLYPSKRDNNSKGIYYIDNVRITITNKSSATSILLRSLQFNTSGLINLTDVKHKINYDASIEPTQSGNTVTKTNHWLLQYLVQGVNCLRDNKVETNSAATLTSLNIKGTGNSTATINADMSNNLYVDIGSGNIPFAVFPTLVRPSKANTNNIELGNTDSYWKSVRAGKYIVHGGTSSQFLKADGSVDSASYQPTISDLATIRSNATNGNTAYGWGNHANAGYAIQSEVTEELNHIYETLLDEIPTELPPTDNSVTTSKIADNAVTTNKIPNKAIIGSKIGHQEISTDHIANKSITNEKLDKSGIAINGIPISLGGKGQVLGLVTANGHKCFVEIANNELILSAPTFAENGSIWEIVEIARYPLLTELPAIPNPTANATEITNLDNWFNANINSYIIPKDLMYDLLSGKNSISQMLLQLNDANCTLTSYNLDFKQKGVDMTTLISDLTTKEGYEVYVENDIDSITTSGICTLKFKIDNHNIIIECYRKVEL